jgi:polyisoprenyl-phosphate glycosyltransferase
MNNSLVSIVVPMYFEEAVAEVCYKRLTDVMKENDINYEIIFVNDGSTDRTLDILEHIALYDRCIKIISLSRNFGHQAAITAGMDRASGEAVVVIDSDLQDPPELIPQMVKLWEEGYEVVYAKRMKREGESRFKLLTAKLFYRFLNKMSSVSIPVDTGDFRLMDRKVIQALKKMPEHNRFVRGMVSWSGFKQVPILYERKERYAGETKYPFKKMLKFALDGILSFSVKPIKLVETAGLLILCVSGSLFILAVMNLIFKVQSSSWLPIATLITFMVGLQIISVGIVGEYVIRVYDECRSRPLYIVDKEINMDEQQQKKVV